MDIVVSRVHLVKKSVMWIVLRQSMLIFWETGSSKDVIVLLHDSERGPGVTRERRTPEPF